MNGYGPIPPGTKVSTHFTAAELTTTDHREFLYEQGTPPPQIRANLARLAADLLEPARDLVGRLRVNSGYRCPGLNAVIGGSKGSAHMHGLAADVFPLDLELHDAFERLAASALPFDQLIFEFGRWIHIGAPLHGKQARGERLAIFEPGAYVRWAATDPRYLESKYHGTA